MAVTVQYSAACVSAAHCRCATVRQWHYCQWQCQLQVQVEVAQHPNGDWFNKTMSEQGLLSAFAFYGAYHHNKINQVIHVICVPAIYTTALAFLTRASLPVAVPVAARGLLRYLGETSLSSVSAALPFALGYAGYYLSLTISSRPLLGLSAGALALAALPLSHHVLTLGPSAMKATIGVHVVSWLAQFYGHGVHEGRSPALLDNLWRELQRGAHWALFLRCTPPVVKSTPTPPLPTPLLNNARRADRGPCYGAPFCLYGDANVLRLSWGLQKEG